MREFQGSDCIGTCGACVMEFNCGESVMQVSVSHVFVYCITGGALAESVIIIMCG